jgi:hypothetical protein
MVIVIAIGLATHKMPQMFPDFTAKFGGDTLWASTAYLILVFLFPKIKPQKSAVIALLFSYSIELSRLYHAVWIDNVRGSTLGSLVLRHGFLWSDVVCYTVGVCVVFICDFYFWKLNSKKSELLN